MDQKLERIFFCRVESRRPNEEALDLLVVRALKGERLHRLHVDLREQRFIHPRHGNRREVRAAFFRSEIKPGDFARRVNRDAAEEKRISIVGERKIVGMEPGDLPRFFAVQRQRPDRRLAVIFRGEKDGLRIRRPGQAADGAIEVDGRVAALAKFALINNERLLVRLETGARHRFPGEVISIR